MTIKAPNSPEEVPLTGAEMELVRRIAELNGITEDEAASQLISACMARRIKSKTGKTRAKVYEFKKAK